MERHVTSPYKALCDERCSTASHGWLCRIGRLGLVVSAISTHRQYGTASSGLYTYRRHRTGDAGPQRFDFSIDAKPHGNSDTSARSNM
jgi:hypothetical protein